MATYTLNYDAWDYRNPETGKITRFKKGDSLEGVELSDETVEIMNSTLQGRPMFVKNEEEVAQPGARSVAQDQAANADPANRNPSREKSE